MSTDARAFWVVEPGRGEIRPVACPRPARARCSCAPLHSGVSRGTETIVFRGAVPEDQYAVMRAPHQEGDFPAPVKYGYLSVGVVEEGPPDLVGRTVFCLHPHQTAYVVPVESVVVVPDDVPARRAVLAGTVETAVNALWDAAPRVGDRVAVVGAGMVGCCVARLLAGIPGVRVTLVDVDPARAEVAARLGVGFARPDDLAGTRGDHDLVVHTSATGAGLQLSLDLLAPEGDGARPSWYGDTRVELSLGGSFHSSRLRHPGEPGGFRCSSAALALHVCERLALAVDLLRDPAFDALLTGDSPFEELPEVMPRLADGSLPAICHTITYRPTH